MATFTNTEGTNLGPLPTAWTRPSHCSVHIINCETCNEGFAGQTCVLGDDGVGSARDDTACWPPVTERAGKPKHPFAGWGFYSPGLACPTGYSAACTAQYDVRPEWDIQFRLHEGETAVGCCPEGFQCTNRNGNTCILIASTDMDADVVVPTGSCQGTAIQGRASATFPDLVSQAVTASGDSSAIETVLAVRKVTLLVPMIQMNYRSVDLLATESSSEESTIETGTSTTRGSTTVSTTTSGETFASATPSQDAAESVAPTTDSGMPIEKIAMIVGMVVGGLLVLGLAAWLLWRWHKHRQNQAKVINGADSWNAHPREYTEYYNYPKHDNIDAYGVAKPVEMEVYTGPPPVVELAGDYGRDAGSEGTGWRPRKAPA